MNTKDLKLEVKRGIKYILDTHHTVIVGEEYPYDERITEYVMKLILAELKIMWNKTQPDIVPDGWKPETLEGQYLEKRIKELSTETYAQARQSRMEALKPVAEVFANEFIKHINGDNTND